MNKFALVYLNSTIVKSLLGTFLFALTFVHITTVWAAEDGASRQTLSTNKQNNTNTDNRVITRPNRVDIAPATTNSQIKPRVPVDLVKSSLLYKLPFKAQDFIGEEKVFWGAPEHGSKGVQKFGYDLTGMTYRKGSWSQIDSDDDKRAFHNKKMSEFLGLSVTTTNSAYVLHGKPVYAMKGGKVIACWRNAPENFGWMDYSPSLGTITIKTNSEGKKYAALSNGRIYGGGNHVWIEHANGTRVEYAHFQAGSVPANICPHENALLPAAIATPKVTDAWSQIYVPASKQVTVQAGQFLGKVGNSGTSSHPHLHIHMEKGGVVTSTHKKSTSASKIEAVEINFSHGTFAPKDNSKKSGDISWKSFAGKPIPPGPVLIWPINK